MGFYPDFLPKNRVLAYGGSKFLSPTLNIYWSWPTLKIWVKSDLVYFWRIFGVLPQFFAQKLGFVGLWGVKIFIPDLNHLLVLAYPENLSQIRPGLFLADFWGFTPIFAQKLGFGLWGVKIFIPNPNHLLVLAYPEYLSQIQPGLFLADFWGFTPFFCQKIGFWLMGGQVLSPTLIIYWSWLTLKISVKSDLVYFWLIFGVYPDFLPKNRVLAYGGSKFLSPTLIIYWSWTTLKIWVKSDLVYFWLIFGDLPWFLAQKLGFGLGWVKNFIPNLNHLLVLAYPENLSSIGLMVEAVDTFCGTGRHGTGRDRTGHFMII